MRSTSLPHVWNERGERIGWDELKCEYLVKVSFGHNASIIPNEEFGIFKGVKDYDCGKLFLIEIPFGVAPDAPSVCRTKISEIDLSFVSLVEIVAREFNAVFQAFHFYGTLKVEYDDFKSRMREACNLLELARYSNR